MNEYKIPVSLAGIKQNVVFPSLEDGTIMKSFLTEIILQFHRKSLLNLMGHKLHAEFLSSKYVSGFRMPKRKDSVFFVRKI